VPLFDNKNQQKKEITRRYTSYFTAHLPNEV